MPRAKDDTNVDWGPFHRNHEGRLVNWDDAKLAVLMDIRDELRRLNEILYYRPPETVVDIVRTISEMKAG